jgi:hypothetical protein
MELNVIVNIIIKERDLSAYFGILVDIAPNMKVLLVID